MQAVYVQPSLNNRFHCSCQCVLLSSVPKEELQAEICKYYQMSELKAHHNCGVRHLGQISPRGWICLEICEQSKYQSDTTSTPLLCSNLGIMCCAYLKSSFKTIGHQDVQQHAF